MGDFFSFKRLITTQIIGAIYVIGLIAITIGGIVAMFSGSTEAIAGGIMAITIGNVVWRLVCESAIVLFNMHDKLADLHDILRDIFHALEGIQGTIEEKGELD